MKAKNQDSLLVELQNNQMTKENMKNVKGGGVWDFSWSSCSRTGNVLHYLDEEGISHLYLNNREVTPEDLIARNDNCISLQYCN
ncbi:MAG TPA: hypothetical protein PK563_12300 [Tenuifilaceae bacterium]|nr:hypothetical protein [Tenuifilaceae bacterium]